MTYKNAPPALHHLYCRLAVAALALWAVSPALRAQDIVTAVPEFIEFTEADAITPTSAKLAAAQEALRMSRDGPPASAIASAKDVVALAREAFGDAHDNVASALTNLAIVQAENADFEAAVQNYTTAIDIRERASGTIVSAELINPLLGLAGAYMSLGDIDQAIPVFERAIHISHVNEGPENLDQVEIVGALSRAHFFNGDLDTADDLQDAVFRLRARRSDDNFDQYLDALRDRAGWYARLRKSSDAIRYYRRLVRAISRQYGDEDPRLIEPLLAIADAASMYNHLHDLWGGYAAGRLSAARAVRIARANADDDSARLARVLTDQGDWFTARYNGRRARPPYQEAWRILDGDPALHGLRDELFAAPELILRTRLRPVYGVREDASILRSDRFTAEGYVVVTFDVDPLGRPRNVRVTDADPAGLMDQHLRYQVRQFRYRPAFEGGRPRAFEGVTYRHGFRYDPSALTDRDRKKTATTTYAGDTPSGG